jgi:hypothetical protein
VIEIFFNLFLIEIKNKREQALINYENIGEKNIKNKNHLASEEFNFYIRN